MKSILYTAIGFILVIIGEILLLGHISMITEWEYVIQLLEQMFKAPLTAEGILNIKITHIRYILVLIAIDVIIFILGIVIIERKRFRKLINKKRLPKQEDGPETTTQPLKNN